MASPAPLPLSDDAQSSATTLGQRIRARRDAVGLTQEKLAAKCGVSRAAVAQWESGVTRPSLDNLVKAAEALSVWLSWLTVGDQSLPDTPNPFASSSVTPSGNRRGVPVIDLERASQWDTLQATLPADLERIAGDPDLSPRAFALLIRDNSMAPDFSEGDKIILDPDVTPQPGDLVVAKLDSEAEATFKKFRPRGTDGTGASPIELAPLNPDWPTLVINTENPGRIIATLVEQRRYRRRAPQT
jgi:SOS-response transcriptional repressor LexA